MPRANGTPRPPWRTLARAGAAGRLSDRQRRAITAFLSADSAAAAARSSGIGRRSLVRWKIDPVFREGSARCAAWSGATWTFPAGVIRLRPELSKNKSGRVLPLSGELLDVIRRAATARRLDCLHVFHVDGHPIGDLSCSPLS